MNIHYPRNYFIGYYNFLSSIIHQDYNLLFIFEMVNNTCSSNFWIAIISSFFELEEIGKH